MDSFDLVNSLQALPETAPSEVDGLQLDPEGEGEDCTLLTIKIP